MQQTETPLLIICSAKSLTKLRTLLLPKVSGPDPYSIVHSPNTKSALLKLKEISSAKGTFPIVWLDVSKTEDLRSVSKIWQSFPNVDVIYSAKTIEAKALQNLCKAHPDSCLFFLKKPLIQQEALLTIQAISRKWAISQKMSSELNKLTTAIISSSKMATLGNLTWGIAHEIQTPVQTILWSLDQLREMLNEFVEKTKVTIDAEVMDIMQKSAVHISKIVKGLLRYSRNSAEDPLIETDLGEIVDETLAACKSRFRVKGITLTREGSTEPLPVLCRPTQLAQILMNLLNNALDAVETYENPWVKVTVVAEPHTALIALTDCGNGIPVQNRKNLFKQNFTTKPVQKGTGLGLYLSREMIQSQGGELSLDESSGNTRFIVRIPRVQSVRNAA